MPDQFLALTYNSLFCEFRLGNVGAFISSGLYTTFPAGCQAVLTHLSTYYVHAICI